MTRLFALAVSLAVLAPSLAAAGCYADYKARRQPPFQLHYGVIALPDSACASPAAARSLIAERIAQDGWTLLAVLSIFGAEGLAEREGNAGAYFLRY